MVNFKQLKENAETYLKDGDMLAIKGKLTGIGDAWVCVSILTESLKRTFKLLFTHA